MQGLENQKTFSASKTKQRILHRLIGVVNHRSTDSSNCDRELMIPAATEDSSGKQEMNTAYTETSMDMHEL